MTELKIGSGESPRRGVVRLALVALLTIAMLGVPAAGWANEANASNGKAAEVGRESGLGAAAALSSLVYGPLKLAYAVGGIVVGGFAWAFTAGDTEVADKVFTRSLRGNYVITPEILTGQEQLYFIGRDDEVEPSMARPEAVASATSTYTYSEEPGYTYRDGTTSVDSAVSGAVGVVEDSSTITTTETWERPATYDDMGW
ncbi:MAG: hypothetical protein AB8G23_16615 [Myxococcota bacterium]